MNELEKKHIIDLYKKGNTNECLHYFYTLISNNIYNYLNRNDIEVSKFDNLRILLFKLQTNYPTYEIECNNILDVIDDEEQVTEEKIDIIMFNYSKLYKNLKMR